MSPARSVAVLLATCALLTSVPAAAAWAEDPAPSASAEPSPSVEPTPTPTPSPTADPTTAPPAAPTAPAGDTVLPLTVGDHGPLVAKAQAKLDWLGFPLTRKAMRTHTFDAAMKRTVRAFQVKYWMYPTGVIDAKTFAKLTDLAGTVGKLPRQCTEVNAICADKTTKLLRYVVDGKIALTVDARFGLSITQTTEGSFRIFSKDWDHTSSKYGSWMPRAMFFNGGQAVHYSPYFDRYGYNGGTHGCVGIADLDTATWLFKRTPVGTRVYVYSS